MHYSRVISRHSALLVAAALLGCGGSDLTLPADGAPAAITMVNGDNQVGAAGSPLAAPLEVRVVDGRGDPVPNQSVAFTLDSDAPGAQLTPEVTNTGPDGTAGATWTLGSTSGIQRVVARVAGVGVSDALTVSFSASVAAAGAEKLAMVSGDDQTARVGTAVQDPLVVVVTDRFGNPVAGAAVEWNAAEGSVDPASATTGEDGRASTSWVLGDATGSQAATASSVGLEASPVGFVAHALPGSADRLMKVSGEGQSAQAGTEVPDPLVVRLIDAAGNGIPSRPVTWVVAGGGGSISPVTSTTDQGGNASARWTLGSSSGTNTLNAVVSGVGVLAFSAMATNPGGGGGGGGPGGGGDVSPSRLEFRVQPSNVRQGKKISPAVEVVVLDAAGNRFTDRDIDVKLELRGDATSGLTGDTSERSHSGVATFSDLKVEHPGDYHLHATADALPSVDSNPFHVSGHRGHGDGGGHGDH